MKRMLAAIFILSLLLTLTGCAGAAPQLRRIPETSPSPPPTAASSPSPAPAAGEESDAEPAGRNAPPSVLPLPVRSLEPGDEELVCVRDYIPEIRVELRYAATNNFTGQVIYDFNDAWLRYGTVKKLLLVQDDLEKRGCGIMIWDAYRPASAQFVLWEAVPDPRYVGNPYAGYSFHSSGAALDVTLIALDGSALEMPTDFDEFSPLGDRDYRDASPAARENAVMLERSMQARGFLPYEGEWWHFTDERSYPFEDLEQIPFPMDRDALYRSACAEGIKLLEAPEPSAATLGPVMSFERFPILGWRWPYVRVQAHGLQGYVLASELVPAEDQKLFSGA